MTERLSLYVGRASPLHQLHPRTKLTLAGFILACGLLLPGAWATYALFGLLVLPLAGLGRVAQALLRAIWPVVLPFAISIFLIQGFLWPNGTPVAGVGPISLKREGLAFALTSLGRILVVVGGFVLFALTTRPDTLMLSLSQRGLPASLANVIVATIQLVPRTRARAAAILDAQRARGLETTGPLLQRLRALLPLVAPLILSSLIDVEERALVIEARAFNHPGRKTSLIEIGEAGWERAVRWCLVFGVIGLAGLRLWFRLTG